MTIPLWSTITLVTELLVSASIYTIIWRAYQTGVFQRTLAFLVLAYEVLFNISYMISRLHKSAPTDPSTAILTPYETGLAIFHGTFSLIMFLSLVAFFVIAARRYARGENYFRTHRRLTIVFSVAWLVSVLSGTAFFIALYLL